MPECPANVFAVDASCSYCTAASLLSDKYPPKMMQPRKSRWYLAADLSPCGSRIARERSCRTKKQLGRTRVAQSELPAQEIAAELGMPSSIVEMASPTIGGVFMNAARGNPIGPVSKSTIKGPQLVRTAEPVPSQTTVKAIRRTDPHPLAAALIIAGLALTGTITFVGSLASWLLLRDTGVNWMFQGN